MKKKLITLLCLSFVFTGCGYFNNDKDADDMTNDNNQTNVNTDMNSDNDVDNKGSLFTTFETGLANAGYKHSNKVDTLSTSIGAKEGYTYTYDEGKVDIYYFENGDVLDKITKSNMVTVNGVETPVIVNGNYVLFSDNIAYEEHVRSIFGTLK